ncbi:tetratricopeptide repeat protein [Streptomyces sp. NPDC006739]|uniref:tetratricopeptide repeat protein n=1 Tax=Streptomyces sp. NPDC006739 TaxID=3364763 RepID=UPI0036C5BA98
MGTKDGRRPGGWLHRRRQRRVEQNLDALQGTLATVGMTYESMTERLDRLVEEGRTEEAVRLAEAARATGEPGKCAAAELLTCLAELTAQRYEEAGAAIDRAVALVGAEAECDALYYRGVALARQGDAPQAAAHFERAGRSPLRRLTARSALALGFLHVQAGDDDRALPLLRAAYASGYEPVVPQAALNLAQVEQRAGDQTEAARLYRTLLTGPPDIAQEARLRMSHMHTDLGQYEEARRALDEMHGPDADAQASAAALLARAKSHRAQGDTGQAEVLLRTAAEAGVQPQSQLAELRLGDLLADRGETGQATLHWRRAAEGDHTELAGEGAQRLGRVLTGDPAFLVTADPATVNQLLELAVGPGVAFVRQVYQTSAELHATAPAAVRRSLLALDAVRRGDRQLASRISAVPLPDEPAPGWGRVAWSTGTRLGGFRWSAAGHDGGAYGVVTALLDGRPVAVSAGADGTVRVWDLGSGEPLGAALEGHRGAVVSLAVEELEGRTLVVSGGDDGTVRIRDLKSRQNLCPPLAGHTGPVTAVATTMVGRRPVAVSAGADATVRLWDLATGEPVGKPLTDGNTPLRLLATAVIDHRTVAITFDEEGVGRVWDLGKRRLTQLRGRIPRAGEAQSLTTAVLDGRPVMVFGGRSGEVVVAEMETGAQVGSTISGEANGARGMVLAQAHGRDIVVTGGLSAIARVYDLADGEELASVYTGFGGQIHAVAATVAEARPVVVLACADGRIRAWELPWFDSPGNRSSGHGDTVHSVATAETDGRAVVVSTGADDTARVWDLATGNVVGTPITGHGGTGTAMATAHIEGRLVVITGGYDGMARVWDPATGEETGGPLAHDDAVNALTATVLDGRPVLVTGDRAGAVHIWDLADRKLLRGPLPGHEEEVADVATALLEGRAVAVTGDGTGTVLVWDLATGARVGEVVTVEPNPESDDDEEFLDAVATAVVEDRPVVVTLSSDDTRAMLRVWDPATAAPVGESLTVHETGAVSLTTAVLGGRPVAITGGEDGTVRVWDLTTREQLAPPTQFTDPVTALAAAPDGRLVVAYGPEVTVLDEPKGNR